MNSRMFRFSSRILILILPCFLAAATVLSSAANAFPLRIDEDCFYGEGVSSGQGFSTWMGSAVQFDPPYTPYTVDGVSVYISRMALASDAQRKLTVSVLDETGIMRQYCETDWRELDENQGWVLIDLSNCDYEGAFTVIVHSGTGLAPSVNVAPEAVFVLGVDVTDPESHSLVYTSMDPPPRPPLGPFAEEREAEQAEENNQKLADVSRAIPAFTEGNWMIRTHSPGLQTESMRIVITQADIDALHPLTDLDSPTWSMPAIERLGPRGMVGCPTNLAGVTLYYHEESLDSKFINPHQGPWAHPDLLTYLAACCAEMAAEGIVGLEHIGIYNPDTWIGGTGGTPSSHQYGKGIDISGFQFADGRIILVEDHDDPEVRVILEHIRDDFLENYFTTVLDWTYQNHDNHFHCNIRY